MFPKGHILSDRYKILDNIGEGGMANVYLAHDTILQRKVAIKVLRGDLSNDELFIKRFRREALAATTLNQPNIVQIYDIGEENDKYYIVMEYIDGITLKQLILKRKRLTVPEVIDITKQILRGIAHAHNKHIIHRDIKPHNIMIQKDGTVKITDFGIAVTLNETLLTQTNSIMGSVHYLPPEQISGNIATNKSDIYSIGVLLYELLTGELPFEGESAVSVALMHVKDDFPSARAKDPQIPQSIENIIIRATAKNPKNRYQKVEIMYSDLVNANKGKDVEKLVLDDALEDETINLLLNKGSDINYVDEEDNKNKKKKRIIIVASITIALATLLAIIIPIISKPNDLIVPDVIGMTRNKATEQLIEEGFKVSQEVSFEYSNEFANDTVIRMNEPPGTEKPEGFTIILTISSGPEKYVLENFVGDSVDEAKKYLENQGFTVSIKSKETQTDADPNIVIEQSPQAGTAVETGQVITLFIAEEIIYYPDMVVNGYTRVDVDKFCNENSISCVFQTSYSDTVPANVVISQSIEAGEKVKKDDILSIVISSGPNPNVDDKNNNGEGNN